MSDWISIENELPGDNADVLVTQGKRIMISTYHGGEFSYDYNGEVTHWQPLPEPPEVIE